MIDKAAVGFSETIEILKQFRDRQGNSIDDIKAFEIAIYAVELVKDYRNDIQNAYDCGYQCGYTDAMEIKTDEEDDYNEI